MLAGEWSRAMQDTRSGSVRDFVAVGDVDIQVIGADAPVLDSEVPVRQILEQVVAKTGIPPFMLGLSWSSTERMSSQQADMLTTEITAIRRTITPVVERICRLWLRMHGYTCGFEVLWEDINLQDEVEDARAALYLEQARKCSAWSKSTTCRFTLSLSFQTFSFGINARSTTALLYRQAKSAAPFHIIL